MTEYMLIARHERVYMVSGYAHRDEPVIRTLAHEVVAPLSEGDGRRVGYGNGLAGWRADNGTPRTAVIPGDKVFDLRLGFKVACPTTTKRGTRVTRNVYYKDFAWYMARKGEDELLLKVDQRYVNWYIVTAFATREDEAPVGRLFNLLDGKAARR